MIEELRKECVLRYVELLKGTHRKSAMRLTVAEFRKRRLKCSRTSIYRWAKKLGIVLPK